jgi:hypothetical protein
MLLVRRERGEMRMETLSDQELHMLIMALRCWCEEYIGAAPETEIDAMDELRHKLEHEREARRA